MKTIASYMSLIFTAGILLAGLLLLITTRLDYCGQPDTRRPSGNAVTVTDAPTPTLAPPVQVVLVRVEADKSDLEVRWLEQ